MYFFLNVYKDNVVRHVRTSIKQYMYLFLLSGFFLE